MKTLKMLAALMLTLTVTTGTATATEEAACPDIITEVSQYGSTTWNRFGGETEIKNCAQSFPEIWIQVCDIMKGSKYRNELGAERTYNCSTGNWNGVWF